ncbi:MAG TPA: transglycosylase domain-containing protein [Actinomycetes bacterium]
MSGARSTLRLVALVLGLTVVASVALVPVAASVAALGGAAASQVAGVPPLGRLLARPPSDSFVYAADGSLLAVLHGDQDRVVVPLAAIPVEVRQAVLAIEDARFYQHGALDLRGIGRALVSDLRGGAVLQGGSTITQQYVKTVVTGDQVSLHRKLVEAVDAARLARLATKDQILSDYLNEVYFGDGVYGIATAAEHYFSKPVGQLDLAEAAALAGTIAGPGLYRPTAGRRALLRRNQVLQRMATVGFASPAKVAAAERQPMRARVRAETVRFPYFVDYVTSQLLGSRALDATLGPAGSAARRRAVYQGGLEIVTSLRPHDQALAEAAVHDQLAGRGPAGALVSLDPASGAIVAMVGGGDHARSKVDLATGQGGAGGFPPGSSFKVFYLVAALEQGMAAGTSFDAPASVTVQAPECPGGYTVHNAETGGLGRIDMARATAESANTYYAQLMTKVGTPAAIQVAKRMGITSGLRDYCSLVLGTENVSPLELASAYATLADGGVHCQPLPVTRITGPGGQVLDDGRPSCRRALDPGIAAAATAILRGVVAPGGTGFRAAFGRPLGGKTGTTTGYGDAWFTGFTPQLATSVWVGDPARQVSMRNLFDGGPVYGGTFPALIFRQYMSGSLAGQPVVDLPGLPAATAPAGAAGPPGPAPTAGRAGTNGRRRHGHG